MVTVAQTTRDGPVPDMLKRRLASLGVAEEMVAAREPEIFRHLRTSCASCEYPEECASDLCGATLFPGWEEYCPNAALLNSVAELCWFRAKIITRMGDKAREWR